ITLLQLVLLTLSASIPSAFTFLPAPAMCSLSLHDALPIFAGGLGPPHCRSVRLCSPQVSPACLRDLDHEASILAEPPGNCAADRSEEHTSELQSHLNIVCRLLLEKKNITLPHKLGCTVMCV